MVLFFNETTVIKSAQIIAHMICGTTVLDPYICFMGSWTEGTCELAGVSIAVACFWFLLVQHIQDLLILLLCESCTDHSISFFMRGCWIDTTFVAISSPWIQFVVCRVVRGITNDVATFLFDVPTYLIVFTLKNWFLGLISFWAVVLASTFILIFYFLYSTSHRVIYTSSTSTQRVSSYNKIL